MDRPILFSTDLVRPTIEEVKTLTSRLRGLDLVKNNPDDWLYLGSSVGMGRNLLVIDGRQEACFYNPKIGEEWSVFCPYGAPGGQLWVRETFMPLTVGYGYKADGLIRTGKIPGTNTYYQPRLTWKPSIHMPRVASRIILELTDIWVERVQDLTPENALREGVARKIEDGKEVYRHYLKDKWGPSPVHSFETLWVKINGRESWDKNPWVWRLSFKLLKCTTPWRTI